MNELLFICTGNYYRSRFAEILFNHLAMQKALLWSATSRGFRLSPNNNGAISEYTDQECHKLRLNYDPDRWPMLLSEVDLQTATKIIALKETEHRPLMRQSFPDWEDKIDYWQIHDIDCVQPDKALAELSDCIHKLISMMQNFSMMQNL